MDKPIFRKLRWSVRWLVEPALKIEHVHVQQEAMLLTIVLLLQSVLLFMMGVLHLFVADMPLAPLMVVFGVLLAVTWVSFALVNRGRYQLGGWTYIVSLLVALLIIVLWGPPNLFITAYLIALMVLVGGLFLPIQQMMWLSVLGLILQGLHGATSFSNVNLITVVITTVGLLFVLVVILANAYWRELNAKLITEQAAALAESEQRFQSIYDQTFQLIGFLNTDGMVMNANRRTMQLIESVGVPIIGHVIWELAIWENTDLDTDMLRVAVEKAQHGYTTSLTVKVNPLAKHDMLIYDVWVRPVYNPMRQVFMITVDARDITERYLAEQQRQQDKARYRALFEQMNDGVFVMGLDGKLVTVNASGSAMLGYTADEMVGLSLIDVTIQNSADRKSAYKVVDELLAGKKFQPYEREVICKDGSSAMIEISPSVVLDENGKPLHVQTIFRDISTRKQHQQSQLQLRVERERVRILENFITSISHDLRTPLSNIKTSAYLLTRLMTKRPEKIPHHISVIEESADLLHRIIDDQLDVLRAEGEQGNGFAELNNRQPVHVNDVVRQTLQSYQSQTNSKQQTITINLEAEVPPVLGNAQQIQRALAHVVANAHQYTPDGGKIDVVTHSDEKQVYIEVIDTGIGISDTDLPYIFDSLYRADSARTVSGAGVGLSIAYKILRAHNGNITVNSTPNIGSKFTLALPHAIQ